jgi:hypothetical protein
MVVPASIQRIEPFPPGALALLHQIPPTPGSIPQLCAFFDQHPVLLNAVAKIAPAEGLDFSGLIERIGSVELIEIGITLLVKEYMQRAFSVSEDMRYWSYTVACAVCCEEIAQPGEDNRLLAYVAGLLHDIGRLALIAAYPDKYANLLNLADRMFLQNPSFNLLEHERLLYGLDHFATGSWLAEEWALPPWLRAVTGKFNEKTSGEYNTLVKTVRLGTRLAHSLGFGYLQAAPRAGIKEILGEVPAAWDRWKTLDYWKHGEEHMRGKIQSRLRWYAVTTPEGD